jgi:hypothetical protein
VTLMQKAITPAPTRAHLFEVHGLGYPGTPFSPDAASIDILRFESSPHLQHRDAPAQIVPLWWLRHSRIPRTERGPESTPPAG